MIRKAEHRDLDALGRLGAMLMRLHAEFDSKRFIAAYEGVEQGYAHFLGSMMESDESRVFVADNDGTIAGYVFVALEPMSWKELRGPAGFIHDLVVGKPFRRAGIGTQLIQVAVSWLRERGAPRVLLGTAAQNSAAHALFHRMGFRDTMIEMTMELPPS